MRLSSTLEVDPAEFEDLAEEIEEIAAACKGKFPERDEFCLNRPACEWEQPRAMEGDDRVMEWVAHKQ